MRRAQTRKCTMINVNVRGTEDEVEKKGSMSAQRRRKHEGREMLGYWG